MTVGDDIIRLEGERGTHMTRAAIELGDMAREQEGNSPRIVRFLNEEKDPRLQQKKKRELELRRTLSLLDQLLKDPEYRAAWEAINTKIDTARVEIDLALIETADLIEDMEDRAPKLKDGRSVFIANDGTGRTKDRGDHLAC